MMVLNKLNFNTKVLLRIQNLFMKQLKITQDIDKVMTSYNDHPIIDMATEEVLKEIRVNKTKKEISEDEYE